MKTKRNETKRKEQQRLVSECKQQNMENHTYISIDCARKFSLQTSKSSPVHFVYVYICLNACHCYCCFRSKCAVLQLNVFVCQNPYAAIHLSLCIYMCAPTMFICSCVLAPFDCCCMQNYRFAIVVCCDFPSST